MAMTSTFVALLFFTFTTLLLTPSTRKESVTSQTPKGKEIEKKKKKHRSASESVVNGPFALTGHMVQNSPYWMTKECGRFKHKGIPTCQA